MTPRFQNFRISARTMTLSPGENRRCFGNERRTEVVHRGQLDLTTGASWYAFLGSIGNATVNQLVLRAEGAQVGLADEGGSIEGLAGALSVVQVGGSIVEMVWHRKGNQAVASKRESKRVASRTLRANIRATTGRADSKVSTFLLLTTKHRTAEPGVHRMTARVIPAVAPAPRPKRLENSRMTSWLSWGPVPPLQLSS